jgi:hypothetical protein
MQMPSWRVEEETVIADADLVPDVGECLPTKTAAESSPRPPTHSDVAELGAVSRRLHRPWLTAPP